MTKKSLTSFILAVSLLVSIPTATAFGSTSAIDKVRLDEGLINITYSSNDSSATKVTIKKGEVKYTYNLNDSGNFSLTLGNGEYEVSVLENIDGNKYKVVQKENVTLNLEDSREVFLKSVQLINWNDNMAAMKKAKSLTAGLKTDKEKVAAIYKYIINKYSYDFDKAAKVGTGYIPSIEKVFDSSKGICYDFAVLFAAMSRSAGIPTKLLMGYKEGMNVYHAWNQVYLKETNSWVTIDTTIDLGAKAANANSLMIKNNNDYVVDKQY